MFWRLELREARLAYAEGRWEEAAARLGSETLREFLPAKRLTQKLAADYASRASQRIDGGRSSAGWRDLARASELGNSEESVLKAVMEVQQTQRTVRLQRAVERLAKGETQLSAREFARLQERGLANRETQAWADVLRKVVAAQRSARKGELAEAMELLSSAQQIMPREPAELPIEAISTMLSSRFCHYKEASARLSELLLQLHEQLAAKEFNAVLHTADAVLELAPSHATARKARRRAWKAVGMADTQAYDPEAMRGAMSQEVASLVDRHEQRRDRIAASTRAFKRLDSDTVTSDMPINDQPNGKRLVAWIDAVGGYLVCLDNEIVLGRPSSSGGADVPISADLSRRHAVIRRDRESYVLQPLGQASVNGAALVGPTVLRDGDRITLGDAVEIDFRRPHVLSATAVLEVKTHHKTAPAVDAIVLMADSCILGPQSHCHIPCRRWSSELVLFRHGDELRCRASAPMIVNGEPDIRQAVVSKNCRLEGEDFALSFETL